MLSRFSRRALTRLCRPLCVTQRVPVHTVREFSTQPNAGEDMRELMREEFAGQDVPDSEAVENTEFFNSAFGVRANTGFLVDLEVSGDTGSHWASEEDMNNPFEFPILNFTEQCQKSALSVCITEQNSDRPAEEVMASVQGIISSLSQAGGPQYKTGAQNEGKNVEGGQQGVMLGDSDAKHTKVTQTMCTFDGVYSVVYPVTATQLESLQSLFNQEPTQQQEDDDGSVPSVVTLQKARDSGGRFDVYLAGKNQDTLFFTSNVTARTLDCAQDEVRRRYDEFVQQCRKNGRTEPQWIDEYLCVERHYVMTLASKPMLRDLPLVLVQMNAQLKEQNVRNDDPLVALLEFPVLNVLTTNNTQCLLGTPDADKAYKAREVEFLLKSVLFGAVFPAPIPPSYIPTIVEDMETSFEAPGAMERVERIARATVAMYGESTAIAAVQPLPGEPLVAEDQLQNDPVLAVLYGDPSIYMYN